MIFCLLYRWHQSCKMSNRKSTFMVCLSLIAATKFFVEFWSFLDIFWWLFVFELASQSKNERGWVCATVCSPRTCRLPLMSYNIILIALLEDLTKQEKRKNTLAQFPMWDSLGLAWILYLNLYNKIKSSLLSTPPFLLVDIF